MNDKINAKKNAVTLVVYVCIFYGTWAVFELILKNVLDEIITNTVLRQIIKTVLAKNLVWTLPAIVLISRNKDKVYISLKEMFTTKIKWKQHLPVFALFTAYIAAQFVLSKAKLNISETFTIEELIGLLFVGLTEELVFRGWLLNVTYREDKEFLCILVNSLMFLVIHFPKWIHDGVFVGNMSSGGFIQIILLSFIFSHAFIKSRNILAPIALHMYWDMLVFMLY